MLDGNATDFTMPIGISGLILSTISWHWTLGLVGRVHWLLTIQSYSADFDPKERWWRRLVKQLNATPGQSRIDAFYMKVYAYWLWLLHLPGEWLWILFVALWGVFRGPRRYIRLDRDVDLLDRRHGEAESA